MSPFTKFLTEMNAKINKQVFDKSADQTLDLSGEFRPSPPKANCWLTQKETPRLDDSAVSTSCYSRNDLKNASCHLGLLKNKLNSTRAVRKVPVQLMARPQASNVQSSVV